MGLIYKRLSSQPTKKKLSIMVRDNHPKLSIQLWHAKLFNNSDFKSASKRILWLTGSLPQRIPITLSCSKGQWENKRGSRFSLTPTHGSTWGAKNPVVMISLWQHSRIWKDAGSDIPHQQTLYCLSVPPPISSTVMPATAGNPISEQGEGILHIPRCTFPPISLPRPSTENRPSSGERLGMK